MPVIDGKGLLKPGTHDLPIEVCTEIAEACKTWGFFQLVNHGLQDPERIFAVAEDFFKLPLNEKRKVERTPQQPMGYTNAEYTKQRLDIKEVFDLVASEDPLNGKTPWPEVPVHFQEVMKDYFAQMLAASIHLSQAIAVGLGIPRTSFHHLYRNGHTSFLRLNFYPSTRATQIPASHSDNRDAVDAQDKPLGIQNHTDAGFLTVLLQDSCQGLEVWDRHRGQWSEIPSTPNSITINIGDMAQVLTNDLLIAPIHRVAAPTLRDRLSVPFFFNPSFEAQVSPLPQFLSDEHKPLYKTIPWGEFRLLRFKGDTDDSYGDDVQISNYRNRESDKKMRAMSA